MERVRFTLLAMLVAAVVIVPVAGWAGTSAGRATTVEQIRNLNDCQHLSRAFDQAQTQYAEFQQMRPYRGAEARFAADRASAASVRSTQLGCAGLVPTVR